jgi:hypothetical protein
MNLNRISLIAAAGCALACAEDVDSSAIRTEGMYAIYEAVAEGNGETAISTQLRVGGDDGTYVRLTDEDELSASTDEDELVLRHRQSGNQHYYEGRIDGDEEGLSIQISFARGEENDDALDSVASLPEPFEAALADSDDENLERGNDLQIVWDTDAPGSMLWSLTGDCIQGSNGSSKDDGSLTIDNEEIEVWSSNTGESCKVTVTLDRVDTGSVDSAFEEGGEYKAIQRRTVEFRSTPSSDE